MTGESVYLKTLCDISRAFATAERKAPLLHRIVENAIYSMDAEASCLYMTGSETGKLEPVARVGLSDQFLCGELEDMPRQIAVMREKGFFHTRDTAGNGETESNRTRAAENIASILSVPVVIENKPMGVLALYSAEPRDFSEEDIGFFSALAEQAGIAMDRARLIEQLRNNTRIFYDLSSGINASLEIPEIMQMLTRGIIEGLKAKAASVRLVDSEDNSLKLIASYGLSDNYFHKGPVDNDAGIEEALAGESLLIEDAAKDDGVLYREAKVAEGIVSILTVPVLARTDVIGVLRLYYGTQRSFYKDELLMVEAVGHQAGLAIHNASCYMKLENAIKDLQSDIWSYRSWF